MNICFISQEYPPDSGWGGIGTYVYMISHALAEQGHHVDVIARATHSDGETEWVNGNLHIHRVWGKVYSFLRTNVWNLYRYFPSTMERPLGWGYGAYKKLQQLLQQRELDIVEAPEHNADAFIYALSRKLRITHLSKDGNKRTKLIVKLHMPMLYHWKINDFPITRDIKLFNMLERWTTIQADCVTSPSRSLAEIVSKLWSFPLEKIHILPYPINHNLFTPDSSCQAIPATVLFVGRLEPRKGIDVLVEAFKKVLEHCPQTKLRLVGGDHIYFVDGKQHVFTEDLQKKVQRDHLQSSVEFVGKVDLTKLPRYYQAGTICVVPSRFDNLPNVCLEAMACGKPVVASICGGLPEMIEDGVHGLLVPPEDSQQLSEALITLLKNPAMAANMGQNARKRIERVYAKDVIATKTAEFYASVLENKT